MAAHRPYPQESPRMPQDASGAHGDGGMGCLDGLAEAMDPGGPIRCMGL
jgi:hypothetical protein